MKHHETIGEFTITCFKTRSNPECKALDNNCVSVHKNGVRVFGDGGFATLSSAYTTGKEFIQRSIKTTAGI